jgi:hypothetical protein
MMEPIDARNTSDPPNADAGSDASPHDPQPFQFRLRTLFVAVTLLCLFLAVPGSAWLLGFMAGYAALSIVAIGVLLCIQAPVFLLFHAMGWLPVVDKRQRRAKGSS